jgi:type I restriction enzyme S subunit
MNARARVVPLQEFCEFSSGGKLKLTKSDYVTDGFPAYSAAGQDGFVSVAEFHVPGIIVSSIGARCGKAFLALGSWTSLANTYCVLPDVSVALPEFLWMQLNDEASWPRSGSAQPFIKPSDIKRRLVTLPPLDEQRRIVDLLNRASAIRRLAEAAQAKARALIPALFVDMFGDPATNPKGWPVSTIGALLREKPNYGTMLKPTLDVKPWHSLRVANIQRGELSLADKKFVDLPASDERRHAVTDGDLLMARAIGSLDHLGKCVVARPGEQRWAFDSHLMRIRVDPRRILPEFVKYCFETPGGASPLPPACQTVQRPIQYQRWRAIGLGNPAPANRSPDDFCGARG